MFMSPIYTPSSTYVLLSYNLFRRIYTAKNLNYNEIPISNVSLIEITFQRSQSDQLLILINLTESEAISLYQRIKKKSL